MGLKILSDIEQANVMIFKAGYEDTGLGPWEGFKVGYYWGKRVKWEGNKAIMPLRKLNREERIKRGSPPLPPAEAPKRKVINMLREINKNNLEINLHPIESWGGEKL